ncbi:hypothetical protein ACT6NV_04355 [Robiginitalea sp. IMCC44478]|uniref:hypothetical protein n=1 Tax=Robiginitalea sp. IMCC44478 TaxID=3459122 RepID=UPI0040423520
MNYILTFFRCPFRRLTRIQRNSLLFGIISLINVLAITAQQPEDVATIDGIMKAYYEVVSGPAGTVVNTAKDKSLHHPDAWVAISYMDKEGHPRVKVMNLEEFHGDNKPRTEGFWERETSREVKRKGNMAQVWSHKEISRTPEGEAFERGVNNITLFYDGSRWWIMGWMIDNTLDAKGE